MRLLFVQHAGAVGQDFLLMDDYARPHWACVINEYIEQEGIEHMDWPVCSSDLNPIERLWGINVWPAQIQTRYDLAQNLIALLAIRKLTRNFNSTCRALINPEIGTRDIIFTWCVTFNI